MLKQKKTRFNMNLDYMREFAKDTKQTAEYIIKNPIDSIKFMEGTLNNVIDDL